MLYAASAHNAAKNSMVMPTKEQLELDFTKAARDCMHKMAEKGVERSTEDS